MIWKFRYRKQAFSFLNEHDLLNFVRDKITGYISGERADVKKSLREGGEVSLG